MIYSAMVKKTNPDIEEEILIQVAGIELTCFVTNWKQDIEIGKKYNVNIGITVLDNLIMKEEKMIFANFRQIKDTFAYNIYGKFNFESHIIDAGLLIEFDKDEVDLFDYSYLDGKNVELSVDRISVEFVD